MPVFRASLFVLRSGLLVNRHALFRPCTTVGASNSSPKFLNSDFSLPAEWGNRLGQLSVDELGGVNFEWLIAVQKKFSSGGKA
uniref:Transposase n=1 Tax=Globodera pallida TaxID=36090 RepID=A0A183BP89_GLOPA